MPITRGDSLQRRGQHIRGVPQTVSPTSRLPHRLLFGIGDAFVAKMLAYSLDYGHVLYCMDNETSTPATWGQYWIEFIKAAAAEKGVTVCTTDMFDDAFRAELAKHTPIIFHDAEHFLGGRAAGELADSELNTVVYSG